MDLGTAVASGVVALGASIVAGLITRKGVLDTIEANSTDLETRLTHERQIARDERNQERIERAYTSLLEYVEWLVYFISVRARVVARTAKEVNEVRLAGGSASEEERARVAVEPSAEERQVLQEQPSARERNATVALVRAVSSDRVLAAFEALQGADRTLASNLDDAELAFMRGPKPSTIDLTGSDAMNRATDGVNACVSATKEIRSLVRAELNQSSTTPPVSGG